MPEFKKLLSKASDSDKAELNILRAAKEQTLKAYQVSPTATNKRDLDAAREGLSECIARLLPVYLPKKVVTTERSFDKQAEAREYLLELGYKVSGGKFSQDSHLFTGVGKRILLSDLMRYAKEHLEQPARVSYDDDRAERISALEERKLVLEVEKREREGRKESHNWIERTVVYEREAALAVRIMEEALHQLKKATPVLINACNGDPTREMQIRAITQQALHTTFSVVYAAGDFSIEFDEDEDE